MYTSLRFQMGRSEVEASLPCFWSLMVSRKCQIHLNPQQENLHSAHTEYACVINAYYTSMLGCSTGHDVSAAEQRSHGGYEILTG